MNIEKKRAKWKDILPIQHSCFTISALYLKLEALAKRTKPCNAFF